MKQDIYTYKQLLHSALPALKQKYPIASMAIFGSYALDDATEDSDIDILVSFNAPIGIGFIDLADELETITGKKVDLVSLEALKPRQFAYIEKSLQYVGWANSFDFIGYA